MSRSKMEIRREETGECYHRKDKDSPIELEDGNANVILSSTPDTKRMGLGTVIADLSNSRFIGKKVNRHTHLICASKELLEAVEAWMEVESESKTNNPCPDYGLRAIYHKKAVKLSKAALKKANVLRKDVD